MEYKYTGIILNKKNVGETDRIYSIYTLEGGKIRSLAKGVRKPQAKLAGFLENITLADVTVFRNHGLGKITGSIVENNYSAIKKDHDALFEIFLAMAIFDKLVDFENPDNKVFELLRNYLDAMELSCKLGDVGKFSLLRLGFVVKLLDSLGYSLGVMNCVSCGGGLSHEGLFFSSQQGGILCLNCGEQDLSAMPVLPNTVKMIRLFLNTSLKGLLKLKSSRSDCDAVRLVVDDFLRWIA
jgi:DNA repair protein RecO (recombination protein O)